MSLRNACIGAGYNGGTFDCDPTPGVIKFLLKWEGKLSVADLMQGDAFCEAKLIAHSKLSKLNSNKLVVFPLIRDPQDKKEANTEVKLADGFSEVTREGLPAFEFKINTTMYLSTQLRKGNNRRTRYAFVDDKNQLLAAFDTEGNVVGRAGKYFLNGLDGKGYDKTSGETMLTLQAENAYETFDVPAVIQLSAAPPVLFKSLKDITIYSKAAATPITEAAATGTVTVTALGQNGVAPTRTVTITAIGANGDTIDIPETLGGPSISGGPVAKTGTETTAAQLATKVAAAITTAGGGGNSAVAAGAVITITLTKNVGDNFNGDDGIPTVTGGITATHTAYTGGVDPDYFDIRVNGTSIIGGTGYPLTIETTPAQFATNIAGCITGNAGYTATATGAVITITSPVNMGGPLTGTDVTVVPAGAQAFTQTPWAGGVYEGTRLKVSGKIPSPLATVTLDFYAGEGDSDGYGASPLGTNKALWTLKKSDGTAMVVSAVDTNDAGGYFEVDTNITVAGTYLLGFTTPDVLDAALVKGIEGVPYVYVKS